jgi:hypothetical protein
MRPSAAAPDRCSPVRYLPRPAPPVASWTGFYVGLNVGYINKTGGTDTDAVALSATTNPAQIAASATNRFDNRLPGFLGGAQVGYDYQFSMFVAGIEADIQGSTLRGNPGGLSTVGTTSAGPFWLGTTEASSRLDYLGTLRGRIGVTRHQPSWYMQLAGWLTAARSRTHSSFLGIPLRRPLPPALLSDRSRALMQVGQWVQVSNGCCFPTGARRSNICIMTWGRSPIRPVVTLLPEPHRSRQARPIISGVTSSASV